MLLVGGVGLDMAHTPRARRPLPRASALAIASAAAAAWRSLRILSHTPGSGASSSSGTSRSSFNAPLAQTRAKLNCDSAESSAPCFVFSIWLRSRSLSIAASSYRMSCSSSSLNSSAAPYFKIDSTSWCSSSSASNCSTTTWSSAIFFLPI
jgi:hypothetical protein